MTTELELTTWRHWPEEPMLMIPLMMEVVVGYERRPSGVALGVEGVTFQDGNLPMRRDNHPLPAQRVPALLPHDR